MVTLNRQEKEIKTKRIKKDRKKKRGKRSDDALPSISSRIPHIFNYHNIGSCESEHDIKMQV